LLAATCGPGAAARAGRGPVDVLYAGSLVNLMERALGPAFERATGYQFTGFGAGSKDLAAAIKGGVRRADVFVSAAPSVDAGLEGAANGDWVSWDASFARSGLVLGYNPHSRFASQLRSRPWYEVVGEPGFLLGRTDPATDPKGALSVKALTSAPRSGGSGRLEEIARSPSDVFPEQTLVGRLQAGQLDAGFFYTVEAREAGIPALSLAPVDLGATFTVTVVRGAPHEAGAVAFVRYLLGAAGRRLLTAHGLALITPPAVSGGPVPSPLAQVLPRP
ncbi:MAG: substrate-binding domain-containing protein, partial [Candidatus Dormibacterales bacterium]